MTGAPVQRFNLQTMSGVFPGTRTPIFQRVQIEQIESTPSEKQWLQLAWYADPAVCVAYTVQPGTAVDYTQPRLRLPEPLAGDFNQHLQEALAARQQRLVTCGSCRFWQRSNAVTPEQLPVGSCGWQGSTDQAEPLPTTLALQSALALPCPHWQPGRDDAIASLTEIDIAARQPLTPMRKTAESAEIRLTFWQRLKKRLVTKWGKGQPQDWEALFLERSGVGAGTEPCFVCQGRIANLGALTVGTPEGDKQTLSVWRCRHCYTLYLNNWIDRWERLDNLETAESYYRIAPAEAKALLTLIYSVIGGEHPNRRHERQAERTYFLNFMAKRTPLSYQVRQGR